MTQPDTAAAALATSIANAVVVRPGDTLIIGLSGPGTADNVREIAEGIQRGIPATVKVCVLDGVQALAVVRNTTG
jgi:hypothetical protein